MPIRCYSHYGLDYRLDVFGYTCRTAALPPGQDELEPSTPDGTCGDHKASFAAVGIVDVVNQLAILMLPVPMILRLEMQMRYRVLIVCIFAVSFL